MFKNIVKVLITFLLSTLIITSNTSAFHKKNAKSDIKQTEWDGSKDKKNDFENYSKIDFCAQKAKGTKFEKQVKVEGKPVIDQNTGEQTIDEDGKKVYETEVIVKEYFRIEVDGYHLAKPSNTDGKLFPTLPKLNFNANWKKLKLLELLKMYCLQDITKDRPAQFKGSYLEGFYTQVAADNNFFKMDSEDGDYNKIVSEGPLGDDIFKEGIIINNTNAVWYVPDFLIEENLKNINEEEKERKRILEEKEKERIRKLEEERQRNIREAEDKGNKQWILDNKKNYLTKFKNKREEYEKEIENLIKKRAWLTAKVKDYEEKVEQVKEDIDIAFDELDNNDQEIKDRKRQIRKDKKIYLSKVDLEDFKNKLKKIKKIKFKKYENYISLNNIIKRAEKSDDAKDFVGKTGFINSLLKKFGIEPRQRGNSPGLIKEFESLENSPLGSGYKIDNSRMNELDRDIKEKNIDIDDFISKPLQELVAYDNTLEEEKAKFPLMKYAIYLVIFLVVVAAVLSLILYLRKAKEDLKEEAEQKVGSLKSDLEDKLKHTSEQIRSVRTSSIRQSQSQSEAQPVVKEEPKTPEQIIADKYDELISDYNDALDDFSKVAGFKQKWNGLALSRKERQDGTKTALISSSRAFEKAEIWCVTFSDKYFAFPGSTVKSNMAAYMNLDFEKATRDFKGVFSASSGSSYITEPCVLRKGGAGFVVERSGKIIFPN